MSEQLYQRCPICRGAPSFAQDAFYDEFLVDCPCARSRTPGWTPIGLSLGQVERLADTERALSGDPGLPAERRGKALARVREMLARLDSLPSWK